MTRKSFKSAVRREPYEFEVECGEIFHARPKIAAGVLLRFAGSFRGGEGDESSFNIADMAGEMVAFMSKAIVRDERDKFLDLLKMDESGESDVDEEDDDDAEDVPVIDLTEAIEIATWLAGVYSSRPTGSDSPDGSSKSPTGDDSMDGALPVVTTYSRADPTLVASST